MTPPRPDVEKFIEDIELLGLHIDEPDCTLCRIRVMCQTLLTYLRAVEFELTAKGEAISGLNALVVQLRERLRAVEGEHEHLKIKNEEGWTLARQYKAMCSGPAVEVTAPPDAAAVDALPRYYCDCLPAGPDGEPSDEPDSIYTEREVILVSDLVALRAARETQ